MTRGRMTEQDTGELFLLFATSVAHSFLLPICLGLISF